MIRMFDNEPGPCDTIEVWEAFLAEMEATPEDGDNDDMVRYFIRHAKDWIAYLRTLPPLPDAA
jgi:hypothetical protein